MNTILRRFSICCAVAAITLVVFAGCKTPENGESRFASLEKLNRKMPWYDEEELRKGVPTRLTEYWSDVVLHKEGQKPQRGFAGRVMFFREDIEKALLVEGNLVVYAFDETDREPTDNAPTRRYPFPAEQLEMRMSPNDLGASYTLWLPWDDAGGPETEVSLICRFEPKNGPVITGEQTRHRLPGSARPEGATAANSKPKIPNGVPHRLAVEQASFQMPVINGQAAAAQTQQQPVAEHRSMATLSLELPESMRNAGNQTATPRTAALPATLQSRHLPTQPTQINPSAASQAPAAGGYAPAHVPNAFHPVTVPVNTPNAAAAIRNGGYRLGPYPTMQGAAATPTYPPPIMVPAGNNAANVMPPGSLPPTDLHQPVQPIQGPQQFPMQNWGNFQPGSMQNMPVYPAGNGVNANVSYPNQVR
jgi:hypothetical protein